MEVNKKMSIRTIEYTVTTSGITPAELQEGVTQKDHNTTNLMFTFDEDLKEELQSLLSPNKILLYRFDVYMPHRKVEGVPTQFELPESISDDVTIEYSIPNYFTQEAGLLKIVFVITVASLFGEVKTDMELYSYASLLTVKPLPDRMGGANPESISTLAFAAIDAKEKTLEAERITEQLKETVAELKDLTVEAKNETQAARFALEHSAEFIFNGGTAFNVNEPDVEVKSNKVNTLSALSTNEQYPGAKCVYDGLKEINNKFNETFDVGDRFEIIHTYIPAVLSGGSGEITAFIKLDKPLNDSVNGITVSARTGLGADGVGAIIRGIGGYTYQQINGIKYGAITGTIDLMSRNYFPVDGNRPQGEIETHFDAVIPLVGDNDGNRIADRNQMFISLYALENENKKVWQIDGTNGVSATASNNTPIILDLYNLRFEFT